jgi:protein involved in polysaccharide export with SLBB domain
VVYVDGAVNKPGKYQLGEPFTIQHAIQQAGGLDRFEEGQNNRVLVQNHSGERQKVRSRDYTSFTLKNGDTVVIPRF